MHGLAKFRVAREGTRSLICCSSKRPSSLTARRSSVLTRRLEHPSKSFTMYHATLGPQHLRFLPAGWLCSESVLNKICTIGYKVSVIPSQAQVKETFSMHACDACHVPGMRENWRMTLEERRWPCLVRSEPAKGSITDHSQFWTMNAFHVGVS